MHSIQELVVSCQKEIDNISKSFNETRKSNRVAEIDHLTCKLNFWSDDIE